MPNTVTGLAFETALAALKDNHRVCRAGWNGKGMWLRLIPTDKYGVTLSDPIDGQGVGIARPRRSAPRPMERRQILRAYGVAVDRHEDSGQ